MPSLFVTLNEDDYKAIRAMAYRRALLLPDAITYAVNEFLKEQWVPTNWKLPLEGEHVLVIANTGGSEDPVMFMFMGYYDPDMGTEWCIMGEGTAMLPQGWTVTHWRSLPNFPEE